MIDHWISQGGLFTLHFTNLQPCGDPRWGGAAVSPRICGASRSGNLSKPGWMGVYMFLMAKVTGVTSMGIHMNMVKHQLKRNQKIFHA